MNRVTDEALDELIEYGGTLKDWPIDRTGILRLVLDLKEARAEVKELKERIARLHDAAIESEALSHG